MVSAFWEGLPLYRAYVTPFTIVHTFGIVIGVTWYGAIHPLWLYPKMRSIIAGLRKTIWPGQELKLSSSSWCSNSGTRISLSRGRQWLPNCHTPQGTVGTTKVYECLKGLQKYLQPQKKNIDYKLKSSKHWIKCLQNIILGSLQLISTVGSL